MQNLNPEKFKLSVEVEFSKSQKELGYDVLADDVYRALGYVLELSRSYSYDVTHAGDKKVSIIMTIETLVQQDSVMTLKNRRLTSKMTLSDVESCKILDVEEINEKYADYDSDQIVYSASILLTFSEDIRDPRDARFVMRDAVKKVYDRLKSLGTTQIMSSKIESEYNEAQLDILFRFAGLIEDVQDELSNLTLEVALDAETVSAYAESREIDPERVDGCVLIRVLKVEEEDDLF